MPEDIQSLKVYIADQMQAGSPRTEPGLDPTAFKMWTDASGDPDTDLDRWLSDRPPLGILHPVTHKGIFPPVASTTPSQESVSSLASSPEG